MVAQLQGKAARQRAQRRRLMPLVEILSSWEAFEALQPHWNIFLSRTKCETIALTWEWLSTWWTTFGANRELFIMTVREGDEVLGIAPLLRRPVRHFGVLPYRRLEFLASGEDEADEICSEYLDFILAPEREAECLDAMLAHLARHSGEWDELVLPDLPARSPSAAALGRLCPRYGLHCAVLRRQQSLHLVLPATWDEFMKGLHRDMRTKVRRDRAAVKKGGGTLRVVSRMEDFEPNFEVLMRLHQLRWTARGQPGVFSSERFTRFHRTLAPKLLAQGGLRLYLLSAPQGPVAALYCFRHRGKVYEYQYGFSPNAAEAASIHSPGLLIQSYAVADAIQDGMAEYDFLKYQPGSYKLRWGGLSRGIVNLRLAHPQMKESAYAAAQSAVAGLRRLKRRLRPETFGSLQ